MGKNYQYPYEDRKEQMKAILRQLEDGVRSVFTSENYIKYLEVYSKFYNYSVNNVILILTQFPTATRVASYKDWNTKFNRVIKKGEHGIKILVPTPKKIIQDKVVTNPDGSTEIDQIEKKLLYFKRGTVFDISQTIGDDLPTLAKNLTYESDFLGQLIKKIFSACEIPIAYDYSLAEFSANGYYRRDRKEIYIKPALSSLHQLKTIAHELSHYYQEEKYPNISKSFDRKTQEVVAESSAFCVLQMMANEFNTKQLSSEEYSFGYVASWGSRDLKELKSTLKLISDISIQIYSWFSDLAKSA